ncbi:MAG: hypothetical protein AAGJ18_15280 [Bacteroidota bacterium]
MIKIVRYTFLGLLLLVLLAKQGLSQRRSTNNTYTVITLNFTYGAHQPSGDLSSRFGSNFSVGGGLDLITEKQNLIFGLKGNNLFGNTVREDVIASLRDSDGFILGSIGAGQGTYADVFLRERGFYTGGHIGKLWAFSQKNKRAGLRFTLGLGLLQHKVRIQDETGAADQLAGELVKGYDQLSNGLALEQFVGYQQLNRKTGVNFFAGFEFTEAFTKNRRAVNFNTQSRDKQSRFDVLIGFRVGWSFTFYVGERGEDIRY